MAQLASTYLRLPRELRDQIHGYLTSPDLLSLYRTCRSIQIEIPPLLQAIYVLELREDVDEHAPIDRLKCMPAAIREWLRRATWYVSSIGPSLMVRDTSHRREIWQLMRSRLCLTELTIVYELPGTWYFRSEDQWIQDTTLEMVLCDKAIASRKRLVICYQPQNADNYSVMNEQLALWVDMCGRLSRIMESDASLESFEIWLPRDMFEQQPIEYDEVTNLRSARDSMSTDIIQGLEWNRPHWILPLKRIKGLKDIRLKLYEAYEPLSQQSQPVEPLPVEGLEAFLRQQMGMPEP